VQQAIEWGVDARGWTSASQENWVFTLATGSAQTPLEGRGKLLERDELGSTLNARVRAIVGRLIAGASLRTSYRRVRIEPPAADDPTSFNRFLDVTSTVVGSDTLAMPDSVTKERSDERIGRRQREARGTARAAPWSGGVPHAPAAARSSDRWRGPAPQSLGCPERSRVPVHEDPCQPNRLHLPP